MEKTKPAKTSKEGNQFEIGEVQTKEKLHPWSEKLYPTT